MEVKLKQKQTIAFLNIKAFRVSSNSVVPNCSCTNTCRNDRRSWSQRLQFLTECKSIQVREMLKVFSTSKVLVHVVKEGETLTSISRLYGVPIQTIVARNASVVDVDLVLEGQCLNIPLNAKNTKLDPNQKLQVVSSSLYERCHICINRLAANESFKVSTLLPSNHLQMAKTTCYLLVLVPLIAFCIRCTIGTIHHKVTNQLRHQSGHEPKAHHHGSKSMRWKSILEDPQETDVDDAEPSHSVNSPEDHFVPYEEISQAYSKLEPAYLKFLSECGMGEHGYWRGGPEEQENA